jgi:hypothetical protein
MVLLNTTFTPFVLDNHFLSRLLLNIAVIVSNTWLFIEAIEIQEQPIDLVN